MTEPHAAAGRGPLVSVVIPTRNRAGLLAEAVESVLAQTYAALEVIVVDDASDDATPDLLARLAQRDARVRAVRQERRGGAPRARNTGVQHARGSLIAFLDDDCVWAPEKLERQLALLDAEHGVVYSRQAIRDGQRWIVEGRPPGPDVPPESLLRTNYIGAPSLVVRRALLEQVGGFDEGLPRLQDWDLLLRLAHHTSFAYVPEILVQGVQLQGGISLDREPLQRAAERIVERHAPHLTRQQLAALQYGLGKFLLVDGLVPVARRFFRASVRLDPASPVNWAGLGAALLGAGPARLVRAWRRVRREAAAGDAWRADQPQGSGERER